MLEPYAGLCSLLYKGVSECMWSVGVLADTGRFCMCLYPHSHSKPIIFPLRRISRHFLASHWAFCLWILHSIFASFRVNGTYCFADVRYHVV